ncbi:MAG: hypothetical protein ACETWK_03445 [Candidatus Aminicenantaceae bacterium]
MTLQPSQPLPGILYLCNTRISVFPEGEELLAVLDGFAFIGFFWLCRSLF